MEVFEISSPSFQIENKNGDQVGQWRFDAKVANIFEDHVRRSVPHYNEIHRMIAELSDWFLHNSSIVYDLGTSTGEAIQRIHDRHTDKDLRFIAVDISKEMVEKAEKKLTNVSNVQFIVSDLNKPFLIENASLVLSILTLQFLKLDSRPRLLEDIYNGLHKGGALILVEKTLGNTPRFNQMWIDLHHDMKRRNNLVEEEIFAKSRSLRGTLVPNSIGANMKLIRRAGFQEVEVFFKWYNWVGILALK